MKTLFTLLILGISCSLMAQSAQPVTDMKTLSLMEGSWQGQGWIMGKDRKSKKFAQTEHILAKLGQSVLMIEGLGYEIDSSGQQTERVVHEAFGLISMDPSKGSASMLSFSEVQGRMECDFMQIDEKTFQWSFTDERSGRNIRFTEQFSEEGSWQEVGEVSLNGKDWYQFFEMKLSRQENGSIKASVHDLH